nr:MAG TPA: hypothetical protein [Caudoviricetes sp.]
MTMLLLCQRNMSIQENINTIFLKNKSDYCFVVIHKWKDRASDEMIKMEKEEKEEEFHKIIPIFLNRNDKNKE